MEKKTQENLAKAFVGESQARNKYTFFASEAKKEGFEQISAIFQETADNEKEHAKRLFKLLEETTVEVPTSVMSGLGDTKANLKHAAEGEKYEWGTMYPSFEKEAREEGETEAADFFREVAEVEAQHEKRYLKLLENVENGKVFKKDQPMKWKCRNCGYVYEGIEAPQECPACKHPQVYYELLAENY
ncbi:MAG: rubrerythrin family protein [Patescibacteria group bacterium]